MHIFCFVSLAIAIVHRYCRDTYVQKYMQQRKWRNWRKIASLWWFELDIKSGPLEAGDFGENRQRSGDNDDKRPGPLETGDFGIIARNACNGETGEKSPASDDLNWMPKVALWRVAILVKMELDAKSGPLKVDNWRGPYNCEATFIKYNWIKYIWKQRMKVVSVKLMYLCETIFFFLSMSLDLPKVTWCAEISH